MKKVVLFTQNLDTGGIQKVVSNLANYLDKAYQINIVLSEDDKTIAYTLSKNIHVSMIKTIKVDVLKPGTATFLMKYRVNALEEILNQINPSLIFSFGEYSNIISLKTAHQCKKIVSQRAVFESMKAKNIHLFSFNEYKDMMIKYYPLAEQIVCVSDYISHEILQLNQDLKPKLKTIHNGISAHPTCAKKTGKKYILNVGRLHPQKGQLDIILAFSKVANKIEHDLLIIGEGEQRGILEEKIDELGLRQRVHLLGEVKPPYEYIHNCELFVFASYYEGFPNVLLEAMSAQKAIVSYTFEGFDEIFSADDTNLCDIGDIKCLSEKILYLLKNKNYRESIAKKMSTISNKFSLEKSLLKYKKTIFESIGS